MKIIHDNLLGGVIDWLFEESKVNANAYSLLISFCMNQKHGDVYLVKPVNDYGEARTDLVYLLN